MREVNEHKPDLGLGRKVVTPTAPKDPWVKGNTPGTYRNVQTGKTETRIPGNEGANHRPMADIWREYLRRQAEESGYGGFQPF